MQINDLSDANDGESLFMGQFAGFNDDPGAFDGNKNYNTAIGKMHLLQIPLEIITQQSDIKHFNQIR